MFWIGDFYSKFRSWNDTKCQALEEKVGEIVINVMAAVQAAEIARAERIQREEDAQMKAVKDAELRERQRAEVKKVKQLLADAENYQASLIVYEYIRVLGGYGDTDNHAMHRYIEWAKDKANWMNPLNEKDDELLGKLNMGLKEFLQDEQIFRRRW